MNSFYQQDVLTFLSDFIWTVNEGKENAPSASSGFFSKYNRGVSIEHVCPLYWPCCANTHTYISLMVSLSPAEFHIDQTVMRKGITALHQQLSPAAPVSI